MSETVIKVENLSKQYRIGAKEAYKNFRETLMDAAKAPFILCKEMAKKAIHPFPAVRDSKMTTEKNTIWALQDVSFEVKKGEVVGIIGPNGAGKSTLLKILSKITEPTKGRIELRGRIGSLLEVGTGFHPELTGHENVYLYGAILGMDRWEVTRKFDEIVAFAELEKFVDTPVKRYSSGMYMRLAFAVAAHLEPEILLVDEVLAVGDISFQKKCLGKMDEVSKAGRTVVFVSHNMGAIVQICQTALLLDSGMLIYKGDVDSVVEKYLSNISDSTGCCWVTDEDPDMPLQVLEIYSANSDGEQCDLFDISDQVNLVLRHRCSKEMTASVVLISVFRNGVELLHAFDTDVYHDRLTKRPVGAYTDEIELPRKLIKAGNITISVRTGVLNKSTTFQDVTDVISFTISEIREDTSFKVYAANRTGALMVTPKWKTIDFNFDSYK
jgi:lipopolysaccharide transport system ATP-binding protein